MFSYLLLRDNKQLGPYSLDELKSFGIKANDLLWIEGRSTAWHFPDEIEELQAFVHVSPISSRHHSNASINIEHKEETKDNFRFENQNEKRDAPRIEKKHRPAKEKANENDPISRRSMDLRKNVFARKENDYFSNEQNTGNKNQQNEPQNFSSINAVKVIIADDHRLFREGVKTALAQKKDVKIIGEAENGQQLLNLLKHNRPDVILLDIQMPVMDGISALASIKKLYADMKVIILSMHEGHSMVSALMETGANGYLTKTADPETIYQAIRTTFEKNYYFNELTNLSMLEGLRSKKKVPEKINTASFDGAELMQRLTEARKKSSNYYTPNTQRGIVIAVGSALLIGAGIIAGMSLFGGPENPTKASVPVQVVNIPQATPKPAAATTLPLQKIDSAKTQSEDSLQAETDDTIASVEKNVTVANIKKDNTEKHTARKVKDSVSAQTLVPIQKIDSAAKSNNYIATKPKTSDAADLKATSKSAIRNLVTASVNNYHVGAFGGLSGVEITINNRSAFSLDEVNVEVQYFLSNSKLYKTDTLLFQNIGAASSAGLKVPKSSRGATVEYKIVSIKSKELDL